MNWFSRIARAVVDWLSRPRRDHEKLLEFSNHAIEDNGWRQGSLVPDELVAKLIAQRMIDEPGVQGIWVVLSQDCDLIHRDLAAEPNVELVFGEAVPKPDKGYTWSKNARELHVFDSTLEKAFAFKTRYRKVIPRQLLCCHTPQDRRLNMVNVKLLARWISRKYFRAAFPNSFNQRIEPYEDKIKKLLSKASGHFQEIHINVTSDELRPEEPYRIIVLCIVANEDSEKQGELQKAIDLGSEFKSFLDKCTGIEVVACDVRTRSEVSLDDLDLMQRWDFDSISIRKTDTIELAPIDL